MAHIPKRATQHGIYLSGPEVPPSSLKPGQTQLARQDLYTTEAGELKNTYLAAENTGESVYEKTIASQTLPEDYVNRTKPMIPALDVKPEKFGGHKGTAHWKSEYTSTFNTESIDGPSGAKPFKAAHPPTCVSQLGEKSSYQKEYGAYGSNPRSRPCPGEFITDPKTELTLGTTKGTCHIPGYQGFLPTNTKTPEVAAHEMGESIRASEKTNLTMSFHQNLPGYMGHVPECAQNDKGARQPSELTVMGSDYKPPEPFGA